MVHRPERICKRKPQTLRHVVCMFNGRFTPETNGIMGLLLVCFYVSKKPDHKLLEELSEVAQQRGCDGKFYIRFNWKFNGLVSNGKIDRLRFDEVTAISR